MTEVTPPASTPPTRRFNPWLSMWSRPRETVRFIIDSNPRASVLVLAGGAGIFQALDNAAMRSAGDELSIRVIFGVAVLLGPIFGIISLYILAFLLRVTGRWIGGTGTSEALRAAIAWANVPYLWVSLLWIPSMLLFGSDLFTTETPRIDADPGLALVFLAIALVEFVLGIWVIIVYCMSVGEAQGFSAWKGLGNTMLALFVMALPIMALAIVLGGLALSGVAPG